MGTATKKPPTPEELLSVDAYLGPPPGSRAFEEDRFKPVFAVHETPTTYEIESELPQAARPNIMVEPHEYYMEVACDRAVDHEEGGKPKKFGAFTTRLVFGHPIEPEHTTSSFRNGRLKIHAPKAL